MGIFLYCLERSWSEDMDQFSEQLYRFLIDFLNHIIYGKNHIIYVILMARKWQLKSYPVLDCPTVILWVSEYLLPPLLVFKFMSRQLFFQIHVIHL
jgi:hypothetical protein